MLITALIICISMASRDFLGSASTAFIAEDRRLLASLFDGLCDIAGLISFGGGTGVLLLHGFLSVEFGLVVGAVMIGSIVGTFSGMTTHKMIDRLLPVHPHG